MSFNLCLGPIDVNDLSMPGQTLGPTPIWENLGASHPMPVNDPSLFPPGLYSLASLLMASSSPSEAMEAMRLELP
jgi:hypothetical protein